MGPKSGWVEKRQHERVLATLKMEYQVVSGPEAQKLLGHENYKLTQKQHLPELSEKSSLYRAVTKDISLGGLSIVSQQPLQKGNLMEISLHLPNYKTKLKFLAEIMHVESTVEMGRTIFHAGIRTLAIHKGDVDRIGDYLIDQKKTGGLAP
jgi:hypothetical protein